MREAYIKREGIVKPAVDVMLRLLRGIMLIDSASGPNFFLRLASSLNNYEETHPRRERFLVGRTLLFKIN